MANSVERLSIGLNGREVVLIDLNGWAWPSEFGIEWFTAFVAADARHADDAAIRAFASATLERRCACMSAWGPECERVHVLFDDAYVTWPSHRMSRRWRRWRIAWSEEIPFLMTTHHDDESLAAALWYAAYVAWPSGDGYYEDRVPALAAFVDPRFRDEVRELLQDPDRLKRVGENPTRG